MTDSLRVHVEIGGESVQVGTAYFHRRRNSVTTTFRYAEEYLSDDRAYSLDPALPLKSGSYAPRGLPGAFADCSPDRWGKSLIAKRLRMTAMRDGRTPPMVGDVDYLLGVSDLTRQGALRFNATPEGPFLDPDLTVPKFIELPRLLRAADKVASDADDMAAIQDLLDAGSGSLGGARPKASVRDGERLIIAKFPHRSDEWDVMAWEKTALDLAEKAGICAPRRRLLKVGSRQVLLLERFDRRLPPTPTAREGDDGADQSWVRVGYMSAMTMLQISDGTPSDYVDLAETLTEFSASTTQDLHELWRRIVFSVAVHNTDDHMRNHGFLREGSGWRLSPVFDVNPHPDVVSQRVTGIHGARARDDEVEALAACAQDFRLDMDQARQVAKEVVDATSTWRQVAAVNGASDAESKMFAPTFDSAREALLAF